jgi:hypothetical protein
MLDIELFALLDGVLRGWSDAPSEVLARLERKPDRWIYELYRDFRSCLIKLPKPETRPAGQLWTYREIGPGTDPIEPLASVLYSHHLVLNIPQWDIYPRGTVGTLNS